MNFTYQVQIVKDNEYGARDSNGKWNGLVGEILDQTAYIAVAPFTITYEKGDP